MQNDVNPIPTFSHEFALKISSSDGDSVGDNWYVDSAATSHMNYDLDEFQNYKKFDEPLKVKLADDSFLLAPGSGDVSVRLYDSACPRPRQFDVLLQNTLYVPDIGNKLFSIASVTENGGSVKLEKTNCTLEQGGKEVGIGTKEGRLYKLNTVAPEHACNLAAGSPLSLWHLRYGHLNYNDLKLLFDQKLVSGLTLTSVDRVEDCHGCAVGKAKRLPFPKKSTRKTTRPLELIHSDVCGPFHVDSVGGSRYFVTFVDDYSRYVTVYMLTAKSEAFDKFVDFVIMSENKFGVEIQNFELEGELGVKLKKFRSDGGGEYVSSRFIEFCSSRGIEKQITVPYTPQQNGVAERMNRTLMEMARSMIYHANCSQKLWAEAVATAAYLRNRCPTSTFQGATPYERWFGEKPDVDHLRIFGCDVYVHVPDQKRRKLEPKAIKGVFVGYPDGTKGYKIFMPNSGKMICSRDVQFLESSFGTRDKRAVVDVFDIAYDKTPCTATDLSQPSPPAHFSTHQFDTNFDTFDTNFDNFDTDFGMNFDNFDTDSDSEINDDVVNPIDENVQTQPNLNVDLETPDIPRVQRTRREPNRYGEWAAAADAATRDPRTFKQAMKSEKSESWMKAMKSEHKSLLDHHTWDLVDLPAGANLVGCKWVYKTKLKANGEIDRYKARLVAQGYSQAAGVDYDEVYAPVAKYKSIRTLLAIGNQLDLEIHQMDVVAAYLNGELSEEIYMKQPEGFVDKRYPNKVCKLKKSLYGLKQSARCWNEKIDAYLKSADYKQSAADPCIYYRTQMINGKAVVVFIGVYVDDTIFMSNDASVLAAEKAKISSEFDMDDRGEIHFILGMEIKRDRAKKVITICQKAYIESVLVRFGMQNCNPVSTPLETGKRFQRIADGEKTVDVKLYQAAIGSLNYAAIATRPDLSLAVGMLSQHMVNPGTEHWSGVKRVLRYLKGTLNYGLRFKASSDADFVLHGYSDADWAGCSETRKSMSGQIFRMGDCTISWRSHKQSIVALSTTEAEYVAMCEAAQEAVWLRRLLRDIGFVQKAPTVIAEDNQGAICLSQNPRDHSRTKHIDIKFHYIREKVSGRELQVQYCATGDMVADTLTKGLPKPAFEKFRAGMGVHEC